MNLPRRGIGFSLYKKNARYKRVRIYPHFSMAPKAAAAGLSSAFTRSFLPGRIQSDLARSK